MGTGCEKNLKKACEYSDILYINSRLYDYAYVFCENRNLLAYEYAAKQQYNLALETLDVVITSIKRHFTNPNERALLGNMYDSKGEIFLMMGREADALEMWNKVMENDKKNLEFYQTNSELYKKLKAKGKI